MKSAWELGLDLLRQEIADAMTPGSSPPEYDAAVLAIMDSASPGDAAVEIASLATEAILRLAVFRGEDPQDTLQWIVDTEWANAETERV